MNKHERAVRKKAMSRLLHAVRKRKSLAFALADFAIHIVPVLPTKMQGSVIDKAWERIEERIP